MTGFKNFLLRGNLIELAVAFIMGTAFATVVKATVDLLLGAIGKVGDQPDFSGWTPGGLLLGAWVTAVIAFLVMAGVVYFFIVLPYTRAKEHYFGASDEPGTPEDVALLTEIRDLLAVRQP